MLFSSMPLRLSVLWCSILLLRISGLRCAAFGGLFDVRLSVLRFLFGTYLYSSASCLVGHWGVRLHIYTSLLFGLGGSGFRVNIMYCARIMTKHRAGLRPHILL